MMRTLIAAPRWVTYALIVVALLAAWGWAAPFVSGPDLAIATIYRPKPVPVEVETVRWLTKVETQIKRERVEVPIEVIREVPAKIEKRLEENFAITLPELRAEGRELVDVIAVPPAPRGGEMALTVQTSTGKIDGIFRAKSAPFIELGGMREAGVDYDAINSAVIGYYRQDLLRVGPGIINGKVFASAPLAAGQAPDYGASIGVAIRF
jgi:hypothetical protein